MPRKPNKSWGGRNARGSEDKVYFGEYLQFCSPLRMIWKRSYPCECVNIRLASSIISPAFNSCFTYQTIISVMQKNKMDAAAVRNLQLRSFSCLRDFAYVRSRKWTIREKNHAKLIRE